MIKLQLAGYQGARSIHTRALQVLAHDLHAHSPDVFELTLRNDVTADGLTLRAMTDSVERGEIEMCYVASGYLTKRVPALAVLDVPFSVTKRMHAYRALDGDAGDILSREVEQATPLRVLAFWDNGFRHISNRVRPIRTPEDCAGLTIRTLDNPIYHETFRAFGMAPQFIDIRDLRRAIETGAVDAQDNPLTNVLNFDIQKHHHFISLTHHFFGVALVLCHGAWFEALSDMARAALTSALLKTTRAQRTFAMEEDESALAILREEMNVIGIDEIDLSAFQRAAASIVTRVSSGISEELRAAYLGATGM